MAGGEPEKGDKVSWNWGGGAPGGEVAEKKTEGEIAITSKKGNKIKKNAEPDNPAIHVKRSGNDVVKKASELNIEKKAAGGDSKKDDSKKRKADDDEEPQNDADKHEEHNGAEVRKGGKTPSKAGKGAKKAKKSEEPEDEPTEEPKKEEPKANGAKKGRRRPKAAESTGDKKGATKEKKPKKEAASRKEGDMVSTRTRSQGKAK
ncbi:hypothetical protein PMZ80_010699 [Knufia obscura]|uniref:Hypervirulence associated protein TUDOR domain-containing protein n=2 Tax=Knufia TaxID=430999 RepID=A0AAN8EJK3_9EURO|nr:hypothetical protein PMZ80_010699 [Knufia obscura]KAK5955390.1 hypothetical protein OHC33_004073 [Knufia fluminis]